MFKIVDFKKFVRIDPSIKQRFEKVGFSEFNFIFVSYFNFIVSKDLAFRIEQLDKVIEDLGGELRGVSFPDTWGKEGLLFAKKQLKDVGLEILEDSKNSFSADVVFKWELMYVPSFINDLLALRTYGEVEDQLHAYVMMNNESYETIYKWMISRQGYYFENDRRGIFTVGCPFWTYTIEDFVGRTKLGFPVFFKKTIMIGHKMRIDVSIDDNLSYGKIVDLMDDLLDI